MSATIGAQRLICFNKTSALELVSRVWTTRFELGREVIERGVARGAVRGAPQEGHRRGERGPRGPDPVHRLAAHDRRRGGYRRLDGCLEYAQTGVRPLRRTIQRRVDNELASMVLSGSLTPGEKVVVGTGEQAGGGLTFDIVEESSVAGAASARASDEDRPAPSS